MKCPKCHYLSFEPEPRCRNCGYDLDVSESDLLLQSAPAAPTSVAELPLRDRAESAPQADRRPSGLLEGRAPRKAAVAATTELPLFVKAGPSADFDAPVAEDFDAPLVRVPAEPRPPLAVRRTAPDTAERVRTPQAHRKLGPLDRDLLEDLQRVEREEQREAVQGLATHAAPSPTTADVHEGPRDRVGAGRRLAAAAIDATFLGGISASLLWITLRWCELPLASAGILPVLPTAGFFLIVGLGYLLMFTAAGGQTIGKMALGLRVVGEPPVDEEPRLSMNQAVWRSILALPSVLAFGLGFIPALMGDERALHDRLTHTRVVRA